MKLWECIATLIKDFLHNGPFWFWISVATLICLLLDHAAIIDINETLKKPSTVAYVVLVYTVSLWLNAIGSHRFLLAPIRYVIEGSRHSFNNWRRIKNASRIGRSAEKDLKELLRTPCRERRWFIWFLEENRSERIDLAYATVQYDKEFKGARLLFKHGLLHSTGNNPYSLVFIHRKLWELYNEELATDKDVSIQIAEEKKHLREKGRAALREELPTFMTERFFRSRSLKK